MHGGGGGVRTVWNRIESAVVDALQPLRTCQVRMPHVTGSSGMRFNASDAVPQRSLFDLTPSDKFVLCENNYFVAGLMDSDGDPQLVLCQVCVCIAILLLDLEKNCAMLDGVTG